ncbi:vWA domain-containing protein [Rhodopirellula halodulae]|uniref:vWA domain-containing protein n=1 Tax=Rhodopirellula halodulae TaxID=2894198 RepID=UPI001E3DC732|nr:VWA domain-containing protein [Rhodopirellula sp. JC737]MCC9657072.1 VWA domain-containing protein [Rhodopirellula sp. JC737]
MNFAWPHALWLLILVPVMAWWLWRRKGVSAIAFSSVSAMEGLAPSLRQRMVWLPKVLTLVIVSLLIVALARPREGREQTVSETEGIAIEMVIDRSGSMRAMDFRIDGEPVDRLTAVKNVASKFVLGEDGLEGRYSDLIGLVTFAAYADAVTPPTLDHSFVVSQLQQSSIVNRRDEDGTAIGDAIALSVEKLNALDARQQRKVQSKVLILLTDGENTAGQLDPVQAAELAETMGVKIYAIGVGTNGRAPVAVRDPFTGRKRLRYMEVNIDEETLTNVAELTGGKYFRATDTDSLDAIYREIDQLEKTEVETRQYVSYRELAVQSWRYGAVQVPPLIAVAMVLMCLRLVVEHLWLKELV